MPVNVVFVLMLVTGFFALQTLGVAMVTILKNLTNIITIAGDYFYFGRTYNRWVWASLALIVVSGCGGAATDLAFNWTGYAWQLANCGFTAAYSLMMKGVMDKARSGGGGAVGLSCWPERSESAGLPSLQAVVERERPCHAHDP